MKKNRIPFRYAVYVFGIALFVLASCNLPSRSPDTPSESLMATMQVSTPGTGDVDMTVAQTQIPTLTPGASSAGSTFVPWIYMGFTAHGGDMGKSNLNPVFRTWVALPEPTGCGVTMEMSAWANWWGFFYERPGSDDRRPATEKLADSVYKLRDSYKCFTPPGGKQDCSGTEQRLDFTPYKVDICQKAKSPVPVK